MRRGIRLLAAVVSAGIAARVAHLVSEALATPLGTWIAEEVDE